MRMQNEWIVYQTDDADELEEAEEEVKDVVQAAIELYLVKIFISEEELRRNCERMEETWKIHKGWCIAKGEEDNFSFLFLSNKLWRWRGGWTIQMRWWWWCQSIKEIWLYTYFHNFLFWFILLGSFFLFQRPFFFLSSSLYAYCSKPLLQWQTSLNQCSACLILQQGILWALRAPERATVYPWKSP